ncbi:hypothetical protein MATL_G00226530 [Megalops atlanticus]|uniref:GB1/RHD3-type G domain-containing protein n=1 Tax=Megalops atlanticus TaxID=7932 RepID=A0A9D3PK07_MEGAT|nr:hypothetical protein MATL_G00226530 [Megalops atlanticus]
MDGPVCLIENTNEGALQVNQEALDILSSIKQPVVVVAIVGMYRTGKSYLMNRLAGKRTGFSLGSTIQSETKGIWMWCVPHPCRENHTLVLLDTEGLGDVEKGDKRNDTWIFALAVLLSSTLVYNSMGTINNEALMSLHYVTELTEHIKVKSSGEKEENTSSEYMHFFPSFIWTVRDFTLELELNGRTITADEYLENISQDCKPSQTGLRDDPRDCICQFFPTRKCFVFDRPVAKSKLKIIDQLLDTDLDPDFIQQATDFCSYIISHSSEKVIAGGLAVTGSMLGNLVVTYVDVIQSGQVPCLENAVLALSQIENSAAVEKSHALYRQLLGEQVMLATTTEEELSSVHEGCLKEALQLFMNSSFKDENHVYQNKLMELVKKDYERKCREVSETCCTALLQQLWATLDLQSYMRPGGYADYRVQLDSIIQQYRDTPGKGTQAEHILEAFLQEKDDQGTSILTIDRNLTEQENRLQEERARAEMEKQKAEMARREQEATAQRLAEMERAHQENERLLREKMERDRIAAQEEHQRQVQRNLEEQRARIERELWERERAKQLQIEQLHAILTNHGEAEGRGRLCALLNMEKN